MLGDLAFYFSTPTVAMRLENELKSILFPVPKFLLTW